MSDPVELYDEIWLACNPKTAEESKEVVVKFARLIRKEATQEALERAAIAAWSAGMNAHNRARGMPVDAREVGSEAARDIRSQPQNAAQQVEQNAGERVSTAGRSTDEAGGGTPSSPAAAAPQQPSETPRTDAAEQAYIKWRLAVTFHGSLREGVDISKPPPDGFDFARQLERELSSARDLANRWMKCALDMAPSSTMTMVFIPDNPEAFAMSRSPVIHEMERVLSSARAGAASKKQPARS